MLPRERDSFYRRHPPTYHRGRHFGVETNQWRPVRRPKPNPRQLVAASSIIMTALLGVLLTGHPHPAAASLKPPLEYGPLALERPYSASERLLHVRILARRNRLCNATVTRLLSRVSDGALVYREQVPGVHVALGGWMVQEFAIPMPVLDDGEYQFDWEVHSDCGPGDQDHVAGSPVRFTVRHSGIFE